MKYLVDNGRLVWALAPTPLDAALLAVLESQFCAPLVTVYDPSGGYQFPFVPESTLERSSQ